MEQLSYAGCAFPVEGLGPGSRAAVWVRGCQRGCPGCLAPDLWRSGPLAPVAQVVGELLPLVAQADGLTVSGGEPFDQAKAVTALLRALRTHLDMDVVVYTGYTLAELAAGGGDATRLLAEVDLLIDGPFIESAQNTLQWRGSDNQQVHVLSERARQHSASKDSPMPPSRPVALQMLSATQYRLAGIPRRGDIAAYRAALASRGLEVRAPSG